MAIQMREVRTQNGEKATIGWLAPSPGEDRRWCHADEVDGIRMGSGASQTASNLLGSITGSGGSQTQGVSVEVGQEEAAIDLTLTAEYGKSVPQLAEAVRRNVSNRIESLVGLRVTEVNITVQNIFFPQQEQEQERQRQIEQQESESMEW